MSCEQICWSVIKKKLKSCFQATWAQSGCLSWSSWPLTTPSTTSTRGSIRSVVSIQCHDDQESLLKKMGFCRQPAPKMWLKVLLHEARVCVTAEMITRWGKWVGIYRRGKWLAHFNQQNASHTHWLIFLKASHPKQKPCLFFKGIQKGKYSYSLNFETAASNVSRFELLSTLGDLPPKPQESERLPDRSDLLRQPWVDGLRPGAEPLLRWQDILMNTKKTPLVSLLLVKHVTWRRGRGEYSDILIEKHVSRCLTRNHGAIPQTVTRSPRIQSHTASANRFLIENESESRLRISSFSSAKRSGWRRWPVKGKYFQVLRKEFGS